MQCLVVFEEQIKQEILDKVEKVKVTMVHLFIKLLLTLILFSFFIVSLFFFFFSTELHEKKGNSVTRAESPRIKTAHRQ